jgi:hypothetical protein
LVDTNNPLTARVIVNRFWEQYFGRGIMEVVEDFGTQSEPPSHPELLNWLATQFMDSGWNMKTIHKLIVMSATYRQNSKAPSDLHQRDPYNRLYARGPRVRLEAEMIRDQALVVSGLLSRKVGGPSVFPPQPEGLWQVVYSGDKWDTSKGEQISPRPLHILAPHHSASGNDYFRCAQPRILRAPPFKEQHAVASAHHPERCGLCRSCAGISAPRRPAKLRQGLRRTRLSTVSDTNANLR